MWVFPLGAAIIALAFTFSLALRSWRRARPHLMLWMVALLMYAAASFAMFLGVLSNWTSAEFRIYWLLGAVLTVPYLAQGEVYLLVRKRTSASALFLVLLFGTAFALAKIRTAPIAIPRVPSALSR